MLKQLSRSRRQSLDISRPSPQVGGLLNRATFPFQTTLVSSLKYWLSSGEQLNVDFNNNVIINFFRSDYQLNSWLSYQDMINHLISCWNIKNQ